MHCSFVGGGLVVEESVIMLRECRFDVRGCRLEEPFTGSGQPGLEDFWSGQAAWLGSANCQVPTKSAVQIRPAPPPDFHTHKNYFLTKSVDNR